MLYVHKEFSHILICMMVDVKLGYHCHETLSSLHPKELEANAETPLDFKILSEFG